MTYMYHTKLRDVTPDQKHLDLFLGTKGSIPYMFQVYKTPIGLLLIIY